MAAQARYVGTFTGPAWTAYLGDRVLALRADAVDAGRQACVRPRLHARDRKAQGERLWDELNPLLRRKLSNTASARSNWNIIRRSEIHIGESGLALMRPQEIAGTIRGWPKAISA
jgi:transposase